MGSKKLGMWLFIISDALTFSVLLLSYSYLRFANPDWPLPFPFSPAILFSTMMTVVLLASSLTMVMAVAAPNRGERRKAVSRLLAALGGGRRLLVPHLNDWVPLTRKCGPALPKPV